MKRLQLLAMAVGLIALMAPDAYSLDYCVTTGGISIISEGTTSTGAGTAHYVQVGGSDCNGVGTGSAALCVGSNSNRAAYIDLAEKDLFAATLSAAMARNTSNAKFNFVLVWETAGSAKGSSYSGQTLCHLVSIGTM
jgi:hypothetical protein